MADRGVVGLETAAAACHKNMPLVVAGIGPACNTSRKARAKYGILIASLFAIRSLADPENTRDAGSLLSQRTESNRAIRTTPVAECSASSRKLLAYSERGTLERTHKVSV